jgi:hypothetical protein
VNYWIFAVLHLFHTVIVKKSDYTSSYVTVIDTVAGLLTAPVLSVTVRLNVRAVDTVGAVNVGAAVVGPFNVTAVPDV